MQTQAITLDRTKARELWRDYLKHQHYSTPIDEEIRRAYQLIAQGRVVIRALESIKAAGLDERGFPKLAIMRATAETCFFRGQADGEATFSNVRWSRGRNRNVIAFPPGSFAFPKQIWNAQAMIPLVPIHLRPKRGLANYHVLWEAEWTRVVPKDPMLLRRIGRADMWLVVAAWELTEVERAALAGRMNA